MRRPPTEPQRSAESRKSRISHAVWELSERLRKEYGITPVIYSRPRPSSIRRVFGLAPLYMSYQWLVPQGTVDWDGWTPDE